MIRIRQIEIPVEDDSNGVLEKYCSRKLNVPIKNIKIVKKSIDARYKPNIFYVYEVDVLVDNEKSVLRKKHSKDIFLTPDCVYRFPVVIKKKNSSIMIVGAGPGGLFCGYMLAQAGYKVTIIDRGEKIEDRIKSVEEFWNTGKLKLNSNVQFGEGGAGTFSDGKLNTLIKDPYFRGKKVLEIFVECGAPEEILYLNKPHIGTDLLRQVIINMRNKMISLGAVFYYNTCLTDIIIKNNHIYEVVVNNEKHLKADNLVLALGHSSRDTFKMLFERGLEIKSKPFAVGIRIEHPQELINQSQYGKSNTILPPASYKLTYKASNNRGVYTFCMCPGGYVVNASSEENRLTVNGMSNYKRDSKNANSAVIVTINPSDYGNDPLDGIKFQESLEEKAYILGDGMIPIQLYGDFKRRVASSGYGDVLPIFKGSYKLTDISKLFSQDIYDSLVEGIDYFGTKIKDFDRNDAIIAGVEARTSSPIRIIRDDLYQSNIKGIYPCGEGAGYAGGITSAAIDGIKVAEAIAKENSSDCI